MAKINLSRIGIIIPVYNGEKYIGQVVDSLLLQKFKDFEVIFVDDGSTDKSLKLLNKYKEECTLNMTIISQKNRGVSAARNCGLKNVNTEFVCFLDVDDEYDPFFLKTMINEVDKGNLDVAICYSASQKEKKEEAKVDVTFYDKDTLLKDYLYGRLKTGVCTLLVKRSVISENSLEFKEGYKYSEDLHMVWRIFQYAERVAFMHASLYIYNKNEGSVMSRIDKNRFDSVKLMEDLESFFLNSNPDFSKLFIRHAKAKISWSILWQAAHYLKWQEFIKFISTYDFSSQLWKLNDFPNIKIRLSSKIFLISKRSYFTLVKFTTMNYRKNDRKE